jgi:hypothetical protein
LSTGFLTKFRVRLPQTCALRPMPSHVCLPAPRLFRPHPRHLSRSLPSNPTRRRHSASPPPHIRAPVPSCPRPSTSPLLPHPLLISLLRYPVGRCSSFYVAATVAPILFAPGRQRGWGTNPRARAFPTITPPLLPYPLLLLPLGSPAGRRSSFYTTTAIAPHSICARPTV